VLQAVIGRHLMKKCSFPFLGDDASVFKNRFIYAELHFLNFYKLIF
jgi:hypothetical protein